MVGLKDFKWWDTRKWIRQVGTKIIFEVFEIYFIPKKFFGNLPDTRMM